MSRPATSCLYGLISDATMPGAPQTAWVLVVHDAPVIAAAGPATEGASPDMGATVGCTLMFMDPDTGAFLYGVQTGRRT